MNEINLSQEDVTRLKIKNPLDLSMYQAEINEERRKEGKPPIKVKTDAELSGSSKMMDDFINHHKNKAR